MTKLKSRNILVFLQNEDGEFVAIGAATSCELKESIVTKEIRTPSMTGWKQYVKRRKSWTVSSKHILTHDNAEDLSLLGRTVQLKFASTNDSPEARNPSTRTPNTQFVKTGYAICTRCTVSGKVKDKVIGDFEFTGTGELN